MMETESPIGVETLISLVQTMVEQSGNPIGFDAARWLSAWLSTPLPVLAGDMPANHMATHEGRKLLV
ncbi:MAG: hypothetical protein ACRYF5_04370, partial [Janthinobacterium lividum]